MSSDKCFDCGATLIADEKNYCQECIEDEWDFPEGTTCNPDAPEECESCQ